VLSLAAAVPNVGRFLPGGLAAPAIALAAGAPVDAVDLVTPVVSTVVLIAIVLAAAAWSFRRQEL
jgi:flagellin-like protein